MPGRTPAEAFRSFIEPINDALSCLGPAKAVTSAGGRSEPSKDHSWTLNRDGTGFAVKGWHFSANMQYRIIREDRQPDQWRISTLAYRYKLAVVPGNDVFRLHWHPAGSSSVTYPHLHANLSPQERLGGSLAAHLETDRMTLERALRWAFELGMPAARTDWDEVLHRTEGLHLEHRSWHRGGPGQG
jgi:hypothetical protein